MYRENRELHVTADVWAENFASRPMVQDWLSAIQLHLDSRWRHFKQAAPVGSRVLDVGCGLGQWVLFLRRQGYDATGVDYSPTLVDELKRRHPGVPWAQGVSQDLPFPDDSFDALISWGVIEHDEDGPQRSLDEFRRVLRTGGAAFVTVPIDSPEMRRASLAHFEKTQNGGVFFQYFFTGPELSVALEKSGFSVELVGPSSRHFAPVLPRVAAVISGWPAPVRDLATQLLRPYTLIRRSSACMVLAAGRKL